MTVPSPAPRPTPPAAEPTTMTDEQLAEEIAALEAQLKPHREWGGCPMTGEEDCCDTLVIALRGLRELAALRADVERLTRERDEARRDRETIAAATLDITRERARLQSESARLSERVERLTEEAKSWRRVAEELQSEASVLRAQVATLTPKQICPHGASSRDFCSHCRRQDAALGSRAVAPKEGRDRE